MSVTPASLRGAENLARQRRAAWRVWQLDVATRPAGAWADLDGLFLFTTGIPVPHWNGGYLLDAAAAPKVGQARRWFTDRAMPWGVLVPAELGVEPPGLAHVLDQKVMLRDLEDLPPLATDDLRWDSAHDAALVQAEAFGEPLGASEAFVAPKLVNPACAVVTAYRGDKPVSTATLVVADGVAAVFGVGTLRGHRRQGLGRATTLGVLHEAVRRGCDLAYLNPSDLGRGVYAGLGFTDAPPLQVWLEP